MHFRIMRLREWKFEARLYGILKIFYRYVMYSIFSLSPFLFSRSPLSPCFALFPFLSFSFFLFYRALFKRTTCVYVCARAIRYRYCAPLLQEVNPINLRHPCEISSQRRGMAETKMNVLETSRFHDGSRNFLDLPYRKMHLSLR